ncbi:common central domain of tyrosinase-domain-containing protein [Xylariales sp. PMI_506]|nr:common central domain of tyrosinase-domain-containing protein [Xylariales sp. PMI_506]
MAVRDSETYGISGVPPPPDAKFKTKTIPYAPGMPFRLEISKLFPSDDPLIRKQWTLFVLGLEQFKSMPVNETLSYFQIAGIHGYPETPWDGADPPPQDPTDPGPGQDPFGGYCHHNSISFPTWHRPYMLLYEKRVWWHMKKIIKEWKLSPTAEAEWNQAADSWRLPYWDWARRQSYNDEFSLPYALTLDIVPIYPPSGETKHPNPLWGFDNPEKGPDGKPRKMGDMPPGKEAWNIKDDASGPPPAMPWSQCSGVSRYGIFTQDGGKTYTGLDGVNNFQSANAYLNTFSKRWYNPYSKDHPDHDKWVPPGTLADSVNRMFSPQYNSTWGTFASTKWWNESEQLISTGYLSLEYIHNNVHNISGGYQFSDGGVGHMSDVPVAAFDPLFWLHHCNIDRLLAFWQVLNWAAWWDTPEPEHVNPNVPDPTPSDPLTPFHTTNGGNPKTGFWTSEEARDWTKLYYQYDDLRPKPDAILPNGTLNEEKYIEDLQAYIQATYPSTLEYVRQVSADERIKRGGFFGPHNSSDASWNDYLINVVYDRYALNGRSYMIQFWLGGAPNDPNSTFSFQENLVGQVYSLGGLAPRSAETDPAGCASCGSQRDNKVLSRAQIPLTIPVISQALDGSYAHIQTTVLADVERYLQGHLHWRFVQIGGAERPASEFPDTKISVWVGTGKPQRATRAGLTLPPSYASYTPLYAPTEGKHGGLTRGDRALGEGASRRWNFRRHQVA